VSVAALGDRARGGDGAWSRVRALGADPLVAVTALTVLAAVLRFAEIGHQGFWYDEANTAQLAHLSLGKMLGLVPHTQEEPPLYFSIAWLWARIFGYGEAGLRSLSAAAGVLLVPVAYAAGAKLISRRAGVIVAALTATSPLLVWYSQEARTYELAVLTGAMTLLAFAYALPEPTPRRLAAWAVACILALGMHYYAVLLVIPEAVWLLVVLRRRRSVYLAIGAIGIAGLALLPVAITQLDIKNANWIPRVPLTLRLSQVTPQFLLGFGSPAGHWLRSIDAVVVVGSFALLAWRGGRNERHGAWTAAVLTAGAALIVLALLAAGIDNIITRNIIVLWLPVALIVAAGLAAPGARGLGLAGAVVLCATGVVAVIGVDTNRSLQRPDWRPVARALGPAPAHVGRAIVIQHDSALLPLALYQPRLTFIHRGGVRVDELDVISIRSPQHPACWWGAACNLIPSRAPASLALPGFHVVGEQRIEQFTVLRLRSARPVYLTRRLVARALTTTELRHDGFILQQPAAGH
jgi:4-amino-4-deoxy-L-arabinose transferase-like glycosyltransferase